MDKIQKRTGCLRVLTAIIAFILVFCLMNVEQKFVTTGLINDVPDNFTDDRNGAYEDRIGDMVYMCTLLSLWVLVFIVANFCHRICLLVEELCHRKARYNGSYKKLLSAVFCGSWNKIQFGSLVVLMLCAFSNCNVVVDACRSNIHMLIMAVPVLLIWFTFKGWSDTEFEHSASCAPCIGIAMAYGVYYNYYQHVLQEFKKRIEDLEEESDIIIPVKKLILLFPSSGIVQSKLDDGNDNLKFFRDLPAIKRDKGGTVDRRMTNPVYKISSPNITPFYCVLEGVNCLSTLKGMDLSNDMFKQQAHLLYMTLKEILDGSPYKNSYVLLCYDDENDNDELSSLLRIKYEELYNMGTH